MKVAMDEMLFAVAAALRTLYWKASNWYMSKISWRENERIRKKSERNAHHVRYEFEMKLNAYKITCIPLIHTHELHNYCRVKRSLFNFARFDVLHFRLVLLLLSSKCTREHSFLPFLLAGFSSFSQLFNANTSLTVYIIDVLKSERKQWIFRYVCVYLCKWRKGRRRWWWLVKKKMRTEILRHRG